MHRLVHVMNTYAPKYSYWALTITDPHASPHSHTPNTRTFLLRKHVEHFGSTCEYTNTLQCMYMRFLSFTHVCVCVCVAYMEMIICIRRAGVYIYIYIWNIFIYTYICVFILLNIYIYIFV